MVKTHSVNPLHVETSKGNNYYLHHKGHFYYFSKNSNGATMQPPNSTITETRTGLPILKRR